MSSSSDVAHDLATKDEVAVANPLEREALYLLAAAGWSTGELAMTFMVDEKGVRRVVKEFEPGFYDQ